MTETDHFEVGIATLSTSSIDYEANNPYKVNGVAIPVNTIVNGGQGVDHYFGEEVLQDAGSLLEGKPIVKNFHELEGQASADDVIGTVTKAGYQQGVGLVFSGEITDDEIAQKIAQGYLDVSPTPARSLGEFDEQMGARRVNKLAGFRDIAVVANGQPGAKIEAGGNSAIEALAMDALSRGFEFDVLESDISIHEPDYDGTTEEEWSKPTLTDFTEESWSELSDEDKNRIGRHFLGSASGFPAETYGSLFLPVVTPSGSLSLPALRNAKSRASEVSGLSGDNLERVISIINRLANEEYGLEWDSMETIPAESGVDEQSDDGTGQSSAANNDTMSNNNDDLSDKEKAVLRAADNVEDAVDVLQAYGAAEQPTIIESDALQARDNQIEELSGVFRDALSERTGLSQDTVASMPVGALCNEFRNEDGEIEAETLSQSPETQQTNPENEPTVDSLSAEEKAEVEDMLRRADLLESRTPEHADTLRSEAAELAGVDDADDIEMEAL